jgi:FtsH-binding integral membrane protein
MDFNVNNSNYLKNVDAVSYTRTFLSNVFMWMFVALGITAFTSYFGVALVPYLISPEKGFNILGWVVLFSPFVLAIIMMTRFNKLSYPVMLLFFIAYSFLFGLSISFIFLMYTASSIFATFAITAGMFGFMAILGYTTKTDLTKFGSIMLMGLVGIIIASIVNMFMNSNTMNYIISFIGVLVFTGLTAYDVQKLKRIGEQVQDGGETTKKLTLLGALTLYLDFINLFLFLLRFFGNRK